MTTPTTVEIIREAEHADGTATVVAALDSAEILRDVVRLDSADARRSLVAALIEKAPPLAEHRDDLLAKVEGLAARRARHPHPGDAKALSRDHKPPALPLRLLSLDEMRQRPPARWLVKGLLPRSGVAVLFGAPGCGKSFMALDVAQRVARGLPFFGRRVRQGPALYLPGEGGNGIAQRLTAWAVGHRAEAATAPVVESVPLLVGEELPELNSSIGQARARAAVELVRPALLIIDTLAQSIPGTDENAAEAMSPVLRYLAILAAEFDLLALVVHHARKEGENESGGLASMRGSSAIGGAADAVLRVHRSRNDLRLTVAKQKDGEADIELSLRMELAVVGEDEDGDLTRSVYLRPATPAETEKGDGEALERFLTRFQDTFGLDAAPTAGELDGTASAWGITRGESRRLRTVAVERGRLHRTEKGNGTRFRLPPAGQTLAAAPLPRSRRGGESLESNPPSPAEPPPLAGKTARERKGRSEVSPPRRPLGASAAARVGDGVDDDAEGADL
jgi:hypothetical protein